MDIERNGKVMGMALICGPGEDEINSALVKFNGAEKEVFLGGIISQNEFLVSGRKTSIVKFSEANEWLPSWGSAAAMASLLWSLCLAHKSSSASGWGKLKLTVHGTPGCA